ncbi:alpha/beta fold hydrolase [Streptomyces endophyticus]|uniref:Alpha/beta hydrolase n=1 Tax=Streptomyces endophyticus TaxID=714166 RepID=A0ABU6F2N2_9ACTN|nr:alpha/beta fold hydrolase [Streptomyces endophyticus]MEB8338104.1 alpha/beta hydrolase [Streptomyces endophyticus]
MPDADKGGTSTPIVLISPAMAIGSRYYRSLVAEFERHGWQARTLRRRGFERGEPRASRREDWAYRDEIDDIAHAVAAARAQSPAQPVLLLGHSLGGQLVAGHELTRPPADGVITVAGAIPRYRHYPYGGLHVAAMAALMVPAMTAAFGYLPKPAFGGPGARTLMREWARMVLTGRPPYAADQPITTPALVISLGDDALSPLKAVDDLAHRLFSSTSVTRWHHTSDQVPEGATHDHVGWVRTPATVVDRIVTWWHDAARS